MRTIIYWLAVWVAAFSSYQSMADERPRARDLGIAPGIFEPGGHNAITDVAGVRVGHATIVDGNDIRTGVTAVLPAAGDMFAAPLPAWIHVGNGYGKLVGATQVNELGQIESPVLLTCTTCVWRAADALKEWMYDSWPIGDNTVNPVVGETNDYRLSNQKANPVAREHVYSAIESASSGPVVEGSVGAGTGTQAFGWKGGIGSSSRVLPKSLGGYTVGILVQTNFGGMLQVAGVPVGEMLGQYSYRQETSPRATGQEDGSIMIVLATNAPLTAQQLERLSMRPMMGLARTGSCASNGSGDYVIAFSTHPNVRLDRSMDQPASVPVLTNAALSPLFAAAVEATEEAIYNALLTATTVESERGRLEAIDIEALLNALSTYEAAAGD